MKEVFQKMLLLLPAPKDFVLPSRYPRKLSMIAGWLYIGVFILGIVSVSSNRWATVDSNDTIDLGYKGVAEVKTTGYYNLRRFSLVIDTTLNKDVIHSVENGKISTVPDNKNIGTCSSFVLAWLVINKILSIPQCLITLYHGWARLNPKVTYIITCTVAMIFSLFLAISFVAYVACKPKKGCKLGWGCWVLFALMIYQIILLVLHLLDKPNGFVRYESGKLIKDEPKPLKRAQSGGYGNNAKTTTPTPKPKATVKATATATATTTSAPAAKQTGLPKKSTKKANPPPPPPRNGSGKASADVEMEVGDNNNSDDAQQQQEKKKKKPQLPKRPTNERRKLVAIYDCEADQEGDLSFKKGNIIYFVSDEPGEGWMTGEINGVQGIFPESYVQDA